MAFDGKLYHHADLIYPAAYHPKSPLTGPALGEALRAAYLAAHRRGRRMIDQNYPVTWRSAATQRERFAFAETTWARIAEGYRRIPAEVTHLAGEAVFSCLDADNESTAYHRVVVYDGSNTDTGSTTETELALAQAADTSYLPPALRYYEGPTYRARFEVTLANVAPGAGREVYVQAYIERGTGGPGSYVPQHIGVWWEIR